ncbi:MAG: hypothetical protein R3E66_14285 [bacterium]
MKMLKWWMVLCVLAAACSDDDSNKSATTDCGDGAAVTVDGASYCVFTQAVVVENGFECPPPAPFLTQGMGFGVCGPSQQIPPILLGEIEQEWKNETGLCTLDSDCAANQACMENQCRAPVNGPNNPVNNATCVVDVDCSAGQFCQLGECVAQRQCGGFAGLTCGAGEYCLYAPEDMCGAADQLGLCEPLPEVCTEDVMPVCGCDGVLYGNPCKAAAAGISTTLDAMCN